MSIKKISKNQPELFQFTKENLAKAVASYKKDNNANFISEMRFRSLTIKK